MKYKRKIFRYKENLFKNVGENKHSRFRGKMGKVKRIMPKKDWDNYVIEKILKPMIDKYWRIK